MLPRRDGAGEDPQKALQPYAVLPLAGIPCLDSGSAGVLT